MELKFKKKFYKSIKKFNKKIQEKAKISLKKFKNWIHDKQLNLHRLSGDLKDFSTINVTWDVRILLNTNTLEVVEVLDIWTHSELY